MKSQNLDGSKYVIEEKICQSPDFFPFPWAFMIVIFTIGFCLFIEKVAFTQNYTHSHSLVIKSSVRSKYLLKMSFF